MGENLCLENHNIIVPSDENHKITHLSNEWVFEGNIYIKNNITLIRGYIMEYQGTRATLSLNIATNFYRLSIIDGNRNHKLISSKCD